MGICVNTHNICDIPKFENLRTNSLHESTNSQQKGSDLDTNSNKLSLLSKKQQNYIFENTSETSSKKPQQRSSTFNKNKNLSNLKSFSRSKTKSDCSERDSEFYTKQRTKSFIHVPSSNDTLPSKDDPKDIRRLTISELGISSLSKAILHQQEVSIIVIGESNVGKTTFALKVNGKPFEKMYIPSITKEIKIKKMKFNSMNYSLKFIVLPGNENYQKDYSSLYSNAKFILVFYDMSIEGSFHKAKEIFKKELNKYKEVVDIKNIDIIFVGNKKDLKINAMKSNNEVKVYCDEQKYEYVDISVRNGFGLKGLLNKILTKTVQNLILFDGE